MYVSFSSIIRQGRPQLLAVTWAGLPMGITTGNRFIYDVRAGETDVFVTSREALPLE